MILPIAEQKRSQNIAEYVLYVWQMEDLTRAADFNASAIAEFIAQFTTDPQKQAAEQAWFQKLSETMKRQRLEKKGHIEEVREILTELEVLHNTLLNIISEAVYTGLHRESKPYIGEFLQKAGGTYAGEVETCLTALYGLLILKLKKTEISAETRQAMEAFSRMMARLAMEYRNMKNGQMNVRLN